MKRGFVNVCTALCVLWFVLAGTDAQAEQAALYTGQVHPSLPMLQMTVTDTGMRAEAPFDDSILQVAVEAQDGSLGQMLTWESIENPAYERIVPLVQLKDLNFDGYNDLLLLSAQGARNVFYAFSLWNEEERRFLPVDQENEWVREEGRFSNESKQTELCNPELFAEEGILLSDIQDGYAYSRMIFYQWEDRYRLTPAYICDIYNAGKELIGETLTKFDAQAITLWDEVYPEAWYYGQNGVDSERRQSIFKAALSDLDNMDSMRVGNTDWVHLRKQDSKSSPSLAKINAGETVKILASECGLDQGWTRVLYCSDERNSALTGYIWHSFLQE